MTGCRQGIECPSFFPIESECGGPVLHDLTVSGGGLSSSNAPEISAALIQLHTDSRVGGERGWWGDEFGPFPIGSGTWALFDQKNSEAFRVTRLEEGVRTALKPLLSQKLVDEILVSATRTIDGADISVDLRKGGASIFRATFND